MNAETLKGVNYIEYALWSSLRAQGSLFQE